MGYHLSLSFEQTAQTIAKSQLNSNSVDNLSEERAVKSTLGSGFLMLIKLTRCQFSTLLGNVQKQTQGIFLIRDNGGIKGSQCLYCKATKLERPRDP